jgi:CheY-like chemotaxis protein/two-component sensor histidine kinase
MAKPDAKSDGEFAPVHQMLERQVNHLVRLVDDLLDVSRITHDQIELRREPVALAAIVRAAVETVQPLIESAGHELRLSLPDDPLVFDADPVRLTQVLANLLNNAAKYTPDGGRIELVARRDGSHAVISVRDSGIGMRADMLPRVFELFMQGPRGYKRRQGGLGIGLTLSKRLVEMHGGTVSARSEGEGKGAEFEVRLPLALAGAAGGPEAELRPAGIVMRRVLVVDDNRDAADSLGTLLTLLGVDVTVVHDGTAALNALRTSRPTAVLLDIGMPDMDGYELARQIRQQPEGQAVRLIAVTGWGQAEDRLRSHEAGIDHHVIKPVDCNALVDLLSRSSVQYRQA